MAEPGNIHNARTGAHATATTDSVAATTDSVPVAPRDTVLLSRPSFNNGIVTFTPTSEYINIGKLRVATTQKDSYKQIVPRGTSEVQESGVLTMLILLFIGMIITYKGSIGFIKNGISLIFSNRERQSMFDQNDERESKSVFVLNILSSVICGMCLYYIIIYFNSALLQCNILLSIGICVALSIAYYYMKGAAYFALGNIFDTLANATQWIQGYNAVHAAMAIILYPVVAIMVIQASIANIMLVIATIIYILFIFIFILKGFRLFFNNTYGIVYFILYLCAVEIVPLFLLYLGGYTLLTYCLNS